jgi:outer membrane protein W
MFKRVLFFIFLPLCSFAQEIQLDAHVGLSGYQGDLESSRFNVGNLHAALGIGGTYYVKPQIAVRALFTYTNIQGNDRADDGTIRNIRNLNFKSQILEAQIAGEYHFFNFRNKGFSPYIFAGLAFFKFDPYTHDVNGHKVMLRKLGTEGQYLAAYPDVNPYKNSGLAIPFGVGIISPLTHNVRIGAEFSLRKLFTDYLDDVSGNYADSAMLASSGSPLAAQMAYRGNEIAGAPGYPAARAQRGNPSNKDWYYTASLRISYVLNARKSKNGKTACPEVL